MSANVSTQSSTVKAYVTLLMAGLGCSIVFVIAMIAGNSMLSLTSLMGAVIFLAVILHDMKEKRSTRKLVPIRS